MTLTLAAAAAAAFAAASATTDLGDLSLEELAQITVASVSKREEILFETPADAYVITAADILRSGVRTLPEALRLAPGVEVAQTGPDDWSITMRGLNSDLSNKLLVLIDGRSVYSPLYAGVFWDVQHVVLEDVDRIEVIGGPAGTMWGANAVNGVINIITKPAADTPGGLFTVSGDDPWTSELRYGSGVAGGDARGYLRQFDHDAREHTQAGFRWDRGDDDERFTVQGDAYSGSTDGVFRSDFTPPALPVDVPGEVVVRGYNLIARWTRVDAEGDRLRVRGYVDHTYRDLPGTFTERRDTLDVELQQSLAPRGRHQWTWGVGARHSADEVGSTSFARFDPPKRSTLTPHAFAQDVIALTDALRLTLGTKLEHNDFTGFELQPQVRAAWRLADGAMLWGAVSRAVRVPSRLDRDLTLTAPVPVVGLPLPLFVVVDTNPSFDSEELVAYELGHRLRIDSSWSIDIAAFHHDYDDLQVTTVGAPTVVGDTHLVIRGTLQNGMRGSSNGALLAVNYSPMPSLRAQYHYTYLNLDLENEPGVVSSGPSLAGNSPEDTHALRVFWDVGADVSVYASWRSVGALPNAGTPAYGVADLSIRWSPTRRLDLSLTATDVGGRHAEFPGYVVEPAIAGRVAWHF